MTTAAVASQDTPYTTHFQSVSNGLRAARVASAASTLLAGKVLIDVDKQALNEVASGLRDEAAALVDPGSRHFGNESSFAFAGLALSALPPNDRPKDSVDKTAAVLKNIADRLEQMLGDNPPSKGELEIFGNLFLKASDEVGRQLAHSGETIDGAESVDR